MVIVLFGFCLTKMGYYTMDKQKVTWIDFAIRALSVF